MDDGLRMGSGARGRIVDVVLNCGESHLGGDSIVPLNYLYPCILAKLSRTVTHAERLDGLESSAILGTKTNAAKDFDRCMRVSYRKLDLKTNA